jgi:hypothetical protein
VEAPDARLEARSLDPQKVEGLGVDDVEAASVVYEHLGEACVGDDGVNNERVDSWIGDVVWVIITVESDGHRRPIKEARDRRLYGENLTPFSLALARREAGRGSSVDHEAVVDLGESPILVVTLRVLLLVLLDAGTLKVPAKHVTVFEVMVSGSLVVGTRLFEHFVKDAPARGASRLLAFDSSDKLIGRGLELALLALFLLPVVSLGAPAGARGVVDLLLPFVLLTAEDGTNCLLVAKLVTMSINPLAVSGV